MRNKLTIMLLMGLLAAVSAIPTYAEPAAPVEVVSGNEPEILRGNVTLRAYVHVMSQKPEATDAEITDASNWADTLKSVQISVDESAGTSVTASALYNKAIGGSAKTGYTTDGLIYSEDRNSTYSGTDPVNMSTSEADCPNYYIFYTNDAIWDAGAGKFTENVAEIALDTEMTAAIKTDTLKMVIDGKRTTPGKPVPCGTRVTAYVEPQDEYTISWKATEGATTRKGDHREISPKTATGNTYTFIMGSKPVTITPTATKKPMYKLTYKGVDDATFNGNAANPNPTQACHGVDYQLVSPAKAGMKFLGWRVNDSYQTLITDGILNDVSAARTLTAEWGEAKYTLSANYIYAEDNLRDDLPVDNNIIKVTLHRDNGKGDKVLDSDQYSVKEPNLKEGKNEYTVYVTNDAITQLENDENGYTPKQTSKKVAPDLTVRAETKVEITTNVKTLIKGEKYIAENLAKQPGEKKVKMISTNKKIAKASRKGVVTGGKRAGEATIEKTVYGMTVSGANLKVFNEVPTYTKSIKLAKKGSTKGIGLTGVTAKPEYESDDPSVATVDEDGMVTAVATTGSTKILITIHNKVFKVKVKVGKEIATNAAVKK